MGRAINGIETASDALRAGSRHIEPRIRITTATGTVKTLTADDILAVSVEEGADQALLPGCVLSASFEAEVRKSALNNIDVTGGTAEVMLLLYTDSAAYLPAGVFVIDSVHIPEQSATAVIRGSDSITSELCAAFEDGLSYPATLNSVWQHAVSQTRYVYSGTIPNGSVRVMTAPDWGGASLRSVFGYIAQAAGCFVRLNRSGSLCMVPCVGGTVHEVDPDSYMSFTPSRSVFGPVGALRVTPIPNEQGVQTPYTVYGDDLPLSYETVTVENNPLFMQGEPHSLAQGMIDLLTGLTLREAEVRWRGDPSVTVGDTLRLTDTKGISHDLTVTRQTLEWSGGFRAECACCVPERNSAGLLRAITPEGGVNGAALVGTVDGGLLAVDSVKARSLAAGSVTAEKLAANSVTAEKISAASLTSESAAVKKLNAHALTALTARLNEIAAGRITTDDLFAAFLDCVKLSCDAGSFTFAEVANLMANTMFLTRGVGGKVKISNLSVTEANIVQLSVGDLCLRDANGVLKRVYIDASGEISTGEAMADGTLSGGKLIDGSVTAQQLNADEIFASQGTVMNLIAGRITASSAFVAEIETIAIGAVSETLKLYVKKGDLETYLRLQSDGVYVGRTDAETQTRVSPESFDVLIGESVASSFGDRRQQLGRLAIYETDDGGAAFVCG